MSANDAPPSEPALTSYVVRKDIRKCTPEEQENYIKAVKKMMEPGWSVPGADHGIPDTFPSEYLRIASESRQGLRRMSPMYARAGKQQCSYNASLLHLILLYMLLDCTIHAILSS